MELAEHTVSTTLVTTAILTETGMIDQVIEGVTVIVRALLMCLVAMVKAVIPMGILPRKDIRGQIALITGSGSGLGRLLAIELGKLGARIVLWDVNEKGNNETKAMLEKEDIEAHAYTVNLAKKEEIYAAAEKVKREIGQVDILVNNAGIVTGKKLFDCPDELMELTMAVNTNALFFTGKSFIPSMIERDHGHVVTIASMAGKTGCAGLVDYCASKHGAVGFHESLSAELSSLKKDGVKTTVVCPFFIDTGMFDGVVTKSPTLLPILQPQYVIDNIVEAILTNNPFLALPRFCYIVLFGMGFLPSSVSALLADHFGINETMDEFKGRAKKAH